VRPPAWLRGRAPYVVGVLVLLAVVVPTAVAKAAPFGTATLNADFIGVWGDDFTFLSGSLTVNGATYRGEDFDVEISTDTPSHVAIGPLEAPGCWTLVGWQELRFNRGDDPGDDEVIDHPGSVREAEIPAGGDVTIQAFYYQQPDCQVG
jgi:hypothetical protein